MLFVDFASDIVTVLLFQALASAEVVENSLTDELAKEQEQAIESAIKEEETWLKELAKEENTVIDVDTEADTESELGVGF